MNKKPKNIVGLDVGYMTTALLFCLVPWASASKPNIIMFLVDDFGWANAGWHRPAGFNETKTANMERMIKEGIELDRAYSFQFCSPSRSSLQSGRLATHVNVKNLGTQAWNPRDPVSGFSGIPIPMTGMAEHLKRAGYQTHQIGKWDAGMATHTHSPQGRGYDTSLGYFCHCNDYWNQMCGGGFVDLWDTAGPAFGQNNSCANFERQQQGNCTAPGTNLDYTVGPEEIYEEYFFLERALQIIDEHDPDKGPLFLNYDSHIVHSPLQVPGNFFSEFAFMAANPAGDWDLHRRLYAAMVHYMDDRVVGGIRAALEDKGLWEDTLWFLQSDNGGPSFTGDNHTANNYPLKGAKYTNHEGGIRVNAYVSGGYLGKTAPHMIGKKLEGYVSIADYYATFADIAGVDPTDHRAAAAGLPPIDSLSMWPYFTGKTPTSPRTDLFADNQVLLNGSFKILTGYGEGQNPPWTNGHVPMACWAGPYFPNKTSGGVTPSLTRVPQLGLEDNAEYGAGGHPPVDCARTDVCGNGACLFNIFEDPEERHNLSEDPKYAAVLAEMKHRLAAKQKTFFNPQRTGGSGEAAQKAAEGLYKGFWGPFLECNGTGCTPLVKS